MKVLFDNAVWGASLSAAHADTSYPVTNLNHAFLKKIFKSTEATEIITITFPTARAVDCIYLAFTNALLIEARFYNASSVLIDTKSVPADTLALLFTEIPGVKSVQVEMDAAADVYLGTVAIGSVSTLPDPVNNWQKGIVDKSVASESADGQYLINKVQWRRKYSLNFFTQDFDVFEAVYALVSAVERPIFFDLFEQAHDKVLPVYGVVSMETSPKEDTVHRWKFEITEAR